VELQVRFEIAANPRAWSPANNGGIGLLWRRHQVPKKGLWVSHNSSVQSLLLLSWSWLLF